MGKDNQDDAKDTATNDNERLWFWLGWGLVGIGAIGGLIAALLILTQSSPLEGLGVALPVALEPTLFEQMPLLQNFEELTAFEVLRDVPLDQLQAMQEGQP